MNGNLNAVLRLFGGLALFLYGMDTMSTSLQAVAGQRLRRLLALLTAGPVRGMLAGAAVTAVLQSSSAVTVMVLGFVSGGLLSLRQALPVVFGCNIGTTITAQLLALRLEDARGLVLLAGLVLCFACSGENWKNIGRAVFSFGLLFEGIADMTAAMQPLICSGRFLAWLAGVRGRPWMGFAVGLGMTLAVQSSSATIALLQSFAAQPGPDQTGMLRLADALPVLLGCNVGTTITAVLAALGGSRDAKRVAAAHTIFNLSGAVVFCALLPVYVRLTELISPQGPETEVIARQIANAHTLFNLICTGVWLPLTPVLLRLVCRVIPTRPREDGKG